MINVTIWNEFSNTCKTKEAIDVYPNGHHEVIKEFLEKNKDIKVTCGLLEQEFQGLSDELLENTDVLIWWGHCKHDDVSDSLVEKIVDRVNRGMGFICLHSAHLSKPFKRVVGASGRLCWSHIGEKERLWTVSPSHPIAKGIGEYIELEVEEMYGEPFYVPTPQEEVFICWFEGGRVFRGGITYNRGRGKVFYFQPGHETYPTYYQVDIQRVITNAVYWAYNPDIEENGVCPNVEAIESIKTK